MSRSKIIVTPPVSAPASVRVFSDADGTTETPLYTSLTSVMSDQPYACAAGTDLDLYVSSPQVVWVSAKVAGVEMAGGYGALRRLEVEGGVSRVTVAAPPVSIPTNRLEGQDGPPTGVVPAVETIAVIDSPDAGTFTLLLTCHDPDGGANRVGETTALAFDANAVAIAAALAVAAEAAGWDGVDIADAAGDTTFTWPAVVSLAVGDNSMTASDVPTGDVSFTQVTPGSYGDRWPQGTEWVDVTNAATYVNYGGPGMDITGFSDEPIWYRNSAKVTTATIPTLDTTTDEASVVAQFNLLRTALIAWGLAIDGD